MVPGLGGPRAGPRTPVPYAAHVRPRARSGKCRARTTRRAPLRRWPPPREQAGGCFDRGAWVNRSLVCRRLCPARPLSGRPAAAAVPFTPIQAIAPATAIHATPSRMQSLRAQPRVAGGRRVALRPRARTVVVRAAKKSVGDLSKAELEGKRVFVRADLNVPLDKDLNITDDTRIRAAVPTLKHLLDNGAKVLLTSHLVSSGAWGRCGTRGSPVSGIPAAMGVPGPRRGRPLARWEAVPRISDTSPGPPPHPQGRPKSGPEDKFRLTPVAPRLQQLLGKPVRRAAPACAPCDRHAGMPARASTRGSTRLVAPRHLSPPLRCPAPALRLRGSPPPCPAPPPAATR